jgi:hypothetical protein
VTGAPQDDAGGSPAKDGGGDGGGWSPRDLPGIALWLDSAVGTTFGGDTKLTSWIDQSGNGNNASVSAPCVGPARAANSSNGRDSLAFTAAGATGACVTVADAPSLQFGAGDFAIFVVARYSNVPAVLPPGDGTETATFWKKYLRQQNPPINPFQGVRMFANTSSEAKLQLWQNNSTGNQVVSATASLNDNTFRRFGGTRRGGVLEVWSNGLSDASVTLGASADVSQPGQPVVIGTSADAIGAFGWLQGNVAEIVAVKGTLDNGRIATLDAYLKTKHGL